MVSEKDDARGDRVERDPALDEWVRRAMNTGSERFERPSEEVLLAYLAGQASEEEIALVRAALVRSSEFRQEFLEMAREMETLESGEAVERLQEAAAPDVPDPSSLIPGWKPKGPQIRHEVKPGLWQQIQETLRGMRARPLVWAPAAAAVLALVFLLPMLSQREEVPLSGGIWTNLQPMLAWQFERVVERGTEDPLNTVIPQNLEEAAKLHFLRAISYKDGTWTFGKPTDPQPIPSGERRVAVSVIGESGAELGRVRASIPKGADPVEAWGIEIPGLAVRKIEMESDGVEAAWPAGGWQSIYLTFVCQVEDKFYSTGGRRIPAP